MADAKSKFPDLKEVAAMGNKLVKDISKSVKEIICEYKKNHAQEATTCNVKHSSHDSCDVNKDHTKKNKDKSTPSD